MHTNDSMTPKKKSVSGPIVVDAITIRHIKLKKKS